MKSRKILTVLFVATYVLLSISYFVIVVTGPLPTSKERLLIENKGNIKHYLELN